MPKGSRKNNFLCVGAETPVWQGARTAHTLGMERTSYAARRDGSTPKQGKLFLREPKLGEVSQFDTQDWKSSD